MKGSSKSSFTRKTDTELSWLDPEVVDIKVSESEIKKGGLFSFSYPLYKVTLQPLGWSVKWKESDFVYLRKYLLKIYNNMIIPPLLTLDGKMGKDKLEKKEYYFTKFLQDCLWNPDLKGCYFMQEFLSLTDDKLFTKVMKDREKDKTPEILKNYYTVAGELQV